MCFGVAGYSAVKLADQRTADCPPDIFSEAESDVEEFVGFDARDTMRYADIANRAPLFSSTPIPKSEMDFASIHS